MYYNHLGNHDQGVNWKPTSFYVIFAIWSTILKNRVKTISTESLNGFLSPTIANHKEIIYLRAANVYMNIYISIDYAINLHVSSKLSAFINAQKNVDRLLNKILVMCDQGQFLVIGERHKNVLVTGDLGKNVGEWIFVMAIYTPP